MGDHSTDVPVVFEPILILLDQFLLDRETSVTLYHLFMVFNDLCDHLYCFTQALSRNGIATIYGIEDLSLLALRETHKGGRYFNV